MYALKGVVVHSGTLYGGHYFSFIKNEYNKWFIYNDSRVQPTDEYEMKQMCFGGRSKYSSYLSCGYLLIYERLNNKIYYPEPLPVPKQ